MPLPLHEELISTGFRLVGTGNPTQGDLRRAVSAAYYAMFHRIAVCCARSLIGTANTNLSMKVWPHAYRGLDHNLAKKQCDKNLTSIGFSRRIVDFASEFVRLQPRRHLADYDPDARFTKKEVEGDVFMAAVSIDMFDDASEEERRAFAAWVLFRER